MRCQAPSYTTSHSPFTNADDPVCLALALSLFCTFDASSISLIANRQFGFLLCSGCKILLQAVGNSKICLCCSCAKAQKYVCMSPSNSEYSHEGGSGGAQVLSKTKKMFFLNWVSYACSFVVAAISCKNRPVVRCLNKSTYALAHIHTYVQVI